MRAGGGGMAAAVTQINVLPFISRAEQRPFKIPVHVPAFTHLSLTLLSLYCRCCGYRVCGVLAALSRTKTHVLLRHTMDCVSNSLSVCPADMREALQLLQLLRVNGGPLYS